jgi:hypothetical protein
MSLLLHVTEYHADSMIIYIYPVTDAFQSQTSGIFRIFLLRQIKEEIDIVEDGRVIEYDDLPRIPIATLGSIDHVIPILRICRHACGRDRIHEFGNQIG